MPLSCSSGQLKIPQQIAGRFREKAEPSQTHLIHVQDSCAGVTTGQV